MKRIGVIFALQQEFASVCDMLGKRIRLEEYGNCSVSVYKSGNKTVYSVICGIGQIRAAAATQLLIAKFDIECILNFGLAGGLTNDIKALDTVLVDTVVQADFDISPCGGYVKGQLDGFDSPYMKTERRLLEKALAIGNFPVAVCASSDKFVDVRSDRKMLHDEFGADICEMESAGIQVVSMLNKVPALFVKTVSDSLDGGAAEYLSLIDKAAKVYCDFFGKLIEAL